MKKVLLCIGLILLVSGCGNRNKTPNDGLAFCEEFISINSKFSSGEINEVNYKTEIDRLHNNCPNNIDKVCTDLNSLHERINSGEIPLVGDIRGLSDITVMVSCETTFPDHYLK